MLHIRKMARAASLLAIAASMMTVLATSTASGQTSNPMQVFGLTGEGDVVVGDTVTALINGQVVGAAAVSNDGWVINIQNGVNGATVTFAINGTAVAQTVTYDGLGAAEVVLTFNAPGAPGSSSGTGGDGSLTTPVFGSGNIGSAVFSGGTIEQLSAAVIASGGVSVWAQDSAGNWVRYNATATGATAFMNARFTAAFSAGFAGATAVFVIK